MMFPVSTFHRSALLAGQANGKLDPAILSSTPGQAGGATVVLIHPAARAWRALAAAAKAAGHVLKTSSVSSSYRLYEVQERIFLQRYRREYKPDTDVKWWEGNRWYLWNGPVAAAPGTSNHGWGSAVDVGEERDGDAAVEPFDDPTLAWLMANAWRYGFSWEIQSEPWHLRYFTADDLPPAVIAYEKSLEPAPAPPLVQEDDVPYKTIIITDGTHVGRLYMVTPQGPVWIVNRAQLDAFTAGGIVSKDAPVRVNSAQLGEWIGAD